MRMKRTELPSRVVCMTAPLDGGDQVRGDGEADVRADGTEDLMVLRDELAERDGKVPGDGKARKPAEDEDQKLHDEEPDRYAELLVDGFLVAEEELAGLRDGRRRGTRRDRRRRS